MIPTCIHPFLWSYDVAKMDLDRDKKRIITNVLNLGTAQATDWLFETYSKEEIKDAITNPFAGEWNKKSLHYWSMILDVKPGNLKRKIPEKQHVL